MAFDLRRDIALVREPPLTYPGRGRTGDAQRARQQHAELRRALAAAGVHVELLPAIPPLPTSVFVGDTAFVGADRALCFRMVDADRRGEEHETRRALKPLCEEVAMTEKPAKLEASDVVEVINTLLVARSRRTNSEGRRQAQEFFSGYRIIEVPIEVDVPLRRIVSYVGKGVVALQEPFLSLSELDDFEALVVPEAEAPACEVLRVNDSLLVPAGYPSTRAALVARGHDVREVEISEFLPLGGLTSLVLLV